MDCPHLPRNEADAEIKINLHIAAFFGNLPVLKEQAQKLDKGKGLAETIKEIEFPEGYGVFEIAASRGNINICQYLVEELGFPVDHVAKNGQDEVVELMLSRGVPVDLEINPANGTPLYFAARTSQESTMKILLEHKANVNKIVNDSLSPLLVCIIVGSLKCVKILIEAGADPNLKCALGMAISEGDIRIVKCMLEAGADPNLPDEFGFLTIETAAMDDKKVVVEMLFPLTTPIPKFQNWTVTGIIRHANTNDFKEKAMMSNLPDVIAALYSNKSMCWLRIGDGNQALKDAEQAKIFKPTWPKAHYCVGAAFMMLKAYDKACGAFSNALNLDPTNEDIKKALWEARRGLWHEAGINI